MSNDANSLHELKEAILDPEHSIGERAPGSPFVIVALSYLGILTVGCLGFALLMWAMG